MFWPRSMKACPSRGSIGDDHSATVRTPVVIRGSTTEVSTPISRAGAHAESSKPGASHPSGSARRSISTPS